MTDSVKAAGPSGAAAQTSQADQNFDRAKDAFAKELKAHPGATLEVRDRNGSVHQFSSVASLTTQAFANAASFRIVGQATSDRKGGMGPTVFTDTTAFTAAPAAAPRPTIAPKGSLGFAPPANSGIATAPSKRTTAPVANDFASNAKQMFPNASTPAARTAAVHGLQQALVRLSFMPQTAVTTDGKLGPTTQRALHDFCERYGLAASTSPAEAAHLAETLAKREPVTPNPDNNTLNPLAYQAVSQYAPARTALLHSISAEIRGATPNTAHLNALLHQLDRLDTAATHVNKGLASPADLAQLQAWTAHPDTIPAS